jgi:hypothetical protein
MIFDPKSFVESTKAVNYEWLLKIRRMSYAERMKMIPTLEGEVQTLLDYIVKLKKVEDKLLTRLGFLDTGNGEYRTLPSFGLSERDTAPARLGALDFVTNTRTGGEALLNVTQQSVNVGIDEALRRVRNEDVSIRRVNFKILNAKLNATLKMEKLKLLKAERAAVEKEGAANG